MDVCELTDVLIVGGGPVGLSAALELGHRAVKWTLINDRTNTAQHPKCNTTNSRSMEHFRRLGISDRLRRAGLPVEIERASAYVTNFCGIELGRLPRPYSHFPTPEVAHQISQIVLERELLLAVQENHADQVHFGCRLMELLPALEPDYPIRAKVLDVNQQEHFIQAKHLIAADGASSWVRKHLQIPLSGLDGSQARAFMGGTMLSYYIRSPELMAMSARQPSHATWIINARMRGLMFSQDGKETWVLHYQVPAQVDWKSLDPHFVIGELLFGPMTDTGKRCEFEILSGGPWTGGLALVADAYQHGRIYLVGDAAHLFTPLGGLGMNTGIGDVMNLCWKIAAQLHGWSGPELLSSYALERRPMGVRNSAFGVHCAKVMDGWKPSENLENDNDAAREEQRLLGQQIMREDAVQYLTAGLQLGECYEGSSIVCGDGSGSPEDPWDQYLGLVRAGARAPHFWLKEGVSIYDELGKDFTLLNFGNADLSLPLLRAAQDQGLPMKTLSVESHHQKAPYELPLCLIRPDQHIAWVGSEIDDALAQRVISKVRGAAH